MATYAFISDGAIANTLDLDPANAASAFPGAIRVDTLDPEPGIGWTYSGGAFTPPTPATPPAPTNALYTPRDFMNLFTLTELTNCLAWASMPNLSALQKNQIAVFIEYFRRVQTIDVTEPNTVLGVNMLESAGLIGTGRAAQILASRH